MFSSIVAFILFVGAESSFEYPTFDDNNHHLRRENILDSMELSNMKAVQSNRIIDCEWEDILNSVGLEELQELIEAIATRKGISPFVVLRTLNKRMKSKEEIEETILNAVEGVPHPDLLVPPIMDLPPAIKLPPISSRIPYSLPSSVPINTGSEDETDVVIIPVDPDTPNRIPPMMKPEAKHRKEGPVMTNNVVPPVGKLSHVLPGVFPLLSPVRNNHLRPPIGATVHVNSGDPLNPLNRDVTVTVSPLMTLIEALRQAEIKYQNALGLNHENDVITFAHSSSIDCYIVDSIDDVVKSEDFGWKITIIDRDEQVVYEDFCLPSGKDVLVKPGTFISLTYAPL